jgi:hypothetical protein
MGACVGIDLNLVHCEESSIYQRSFEKEAYNRMLLIRVRRRIGGRNYNEIVLERYEMSWRRRVR